MKKFSLAMLLVTIVVSVSVMFVDEKWASSIPEAASCLLAAGWMFMFSMGMIRPGNSLVLWLIGLVPLWCIAQIYFGWTVYRWMTWLSLLYWLGNFSTLFAGIQIFSAARMRELFLKWLVLFGFAVAVLSSLQALTTNSKIYWMFDTKYAGWVLMGPFVYHNQYAAFIELLLPIALFSAVTDKPLRWLYLLAGATMYASIFIAGSRAGFILTSLELLIVPAALFSRGKLSWTALAGTAAVLLCMIALLAVAVGPEYLLRRFQTSDPYAIRREFLQSSVEMFTRRPLTGVGLGNWATAYPAYALFDDGLYANQAHNDWAQWGVEGGIPMLLVILGVAWWVFPRAIRTPWGCGTAAVLLHCFVDYPLQRPAVAVVFFSLIAAQAAVEGKTVRAPRYRMASAAAVEV
jgi:O-antigen ligase